MHDQTLLMEYDGAAQLRIRTCWSMRCEELSALTGRSVTTLRGYETGALQPKVSTACIIAYALGVDLADLLRPVSASGPADAEVDAVDAGGSSAATSKVTTA